MKLSIKIAGLALLSSVVSFTACNSGSETSTSSTTDTSAVSNEKKMDTSANATTATTAATSPEQDFINYAVPGNTKEIIWLEAGVKDGGKEVKAHSSMMLKDHKKLGETVKDYLSKKPNLTAPTVDTANVVTITDAKGAKWDKAFADKMVEDHQGLLDKLKSSETAVTDADLKKIITSTIPVVQSHLDMAKSMQSKMK